MISIQRTRPKEKSELFGSLNIHSHVTLNSQILMERRFHYLKKNL
ncbi:unnamed protein product [Paramecium sonneborni]|uniref:Uncharacterized protein n=1 Tax=Paramecium sonneborni TaxID=65129 RepID=A0A8S1NPR8_9CILI|nr:unnamed protein product [Paramecium sonneborni]